jgi:hypothetical protein
MAYATKAQLKEVEQMQVVAMNQSNFPAVALIHTVNHFEVDEVFARIGSAFTDSSNSAEKAPIKRFTIREDKEGRSYFRNSYGKFYLDECIRTSAFGGGRGI